MEVDGAGPGGAPAPTITSPRDGAVLGDSTPEVTGEADRDVRIELFDRDGASLGMVQTDGPEWSITTTELADGAHELTARATYGRSRESEPSEPITIVIDTVAPDAPTITSPRDGGFANGSVRVEGTAEPGSQVEISADGDAVDEDTADEDGNWSGSSGGLDDGEHVLTAVAIDEAGNRSRPSASIHVIVDSEHGERPVITSPADGDATNDTTPEVSGTGEPGETVSVYRTGDDEPLGTATVHADGSFGLTTSALADGEYELYVQTTDAAGNESAHSELVTLTVDTVKPEPPVVTSPMDSSVLTALTSVQGTVEAGATVAIQIDGVTANNELTSGASFWVSVEDNLSEGAHALVAVATDAAGNVSDPSDIVRFEIDRTAPAAPTFTLGTRTETVTGQFDIEGEAEAGAEVSLYLGRYTRPAADPVATLTVGADGAFAFTTPALTDGMHRFTVVVTDAAGLTSMGSVVITVDSTPPAPPVITGIYLRSDLPLGNVGGPGSFQIRGTYETPAAVELTIDGWRVYDPTMFSNEWYVVVSGLGQGTHTAVAVATDAVGNASAPSDTFEFTVDLTPPSVDAGADVISNTGIQLDATATDENALTYQWSQASGPGTISFSDATIEDPSVSADQPGVYTLSLMVTDLVGQFTIDTLVYELDMTAPTVVARSPMPDEDGVDVGRSVRVVLSEAIDPTTLPGTFTLNGGAVAGSVSLMADDRILTFTPAALLSPATTYTVDLLAGLEDPAGNPLAPVSWSFTTADAAPRVEPLYTNGKGWNDYLEDDGPDPLRAQNTVCDADAAESYFDCLHAGVLRKVDTGGSSCSNYSATDALDAFEWTCDDSGGTAVLISTGLKPGKRVTDLIDFDAFQWKPNSVSVSATGPGTPFVTGYAEWWSDEVLPVPEDGVMDREATVYALSVSRLEDSRIEADRVTLVTTADASFAGRSGSDRAVWTGAQRFLWIDAVVGGIAPALMLEGTRMSRLDHVEARGPYSCIALVNGADANLIVNTTARGCGSGVRIEASHGNTVSSSTASEGYVGLALSGGASGNVITDFVASDNQDDAFELEGANGNTLTSIAAFGNYWGYAVRLHDSLDNRLHDVRCAANGRGVVLDGADGTRLSHVVSTNNAFNGVDCVRSRNVTITDVLTSANDDSGVVLDECDDSRFADITTVNNYFGGLTSMASSNNVLWNVVTVNNGMGLELADGSNGNSVHNLVAAHNDYDQLSSAPSYGVRVADSSANRFTGELKVGGNADGDCYVDMESVSGDLADDAGEVDDAHDGTCNTTSAALSSFTLASGVSAAASFVGKVGTGGLVDTTADDVNPDDDATPGLCEARNIMEWVAFEHDLRSWGPDGAAFPVFDNRGPVQTGTVRIWDFSPNVGDAGDAGGPVLWSVLATPDGNDVLEHAWAGSAAMASECESVATGSVFFGVDDCRSTFLRDAVELDGDAVGNDNGLCESDERCLYTPNVGAYQGHGAEQSTGNFGDGTVAGVTLLEHADNGY